MLPKLSLLAAWLWFASCAATTSSPSSSHASQDAQPPTSQPAATQPAPAGAGAGAALDADVDALLTRLEKSAAGLTSFTAKITYEKEDAILNRKETRSGEIIYRIDGQKKSFAVLFDKRVIGDRLENRLYHYIFDGRWLAEVDHENKQFIKREIVPPGKELDPLKLGEGPFPLPVGQAKSDVLARFNVAKAEVPKEGLLKSLQNVDGLLLTPKPDASEARDFKSVEIFYDRATGLPVGINAIGTNDDRKTVKLSDLQRNPKLDEATLKKLDIAEPDKREWKISIQPWQGEPYGVKNK